MNKKEVIGRSLGTALLIGSVALGACTPSRDAENTPIATPRISTEQKIPQTEQDWQLLPTQERISRLLKKDNPTFPEFDAFKELVKTTSEIFCQQATCYINLEDMPSHVKLLSPETFLQAYEKTEGRTFSPAEKEVKKKDPEITVGSDSKDRTKREILINRQQIKEIAGNWTKDLSPQQKKALGNYDAETLTTFSILLHSFGHLNQSEEEANLPLTPIRVANGIFAIDKVQSLALKGINLSNNSMITLTGSNEGMTEIIAFSIGIKFSDAFVFSKGYYPTTKLIMEINKKAGITDQELQDYYFGKKPMIELFKKWGSIKNPNQPDISSGIRMYHFAGLAPENGLDKIIPIIEQEMGQKF
ncbi:MAG: hypothetical protein HY425_02660 [Candidatus Levybacteria bacterium]|nr:hypothetical protein [Candidatus Levybacteria bacterium]